MHPILRTFRRELHAFPELGFKETQTQSRVKQFLMEHAKIPEGSIRPCATTGLVVDIESSSSVPSTSSNNVTCIALRADMDGLPMTENNPHLPYRSQNAQCAHMCGHDGHMATLAGVAMVLYPRRHLLPQGTVVRLLFQPAEEGPGGAVPMIEGGCLDGVDEVYGYHNYGFPVGNVHVRSGPVMAHEQEFSISITGKGGHGSAPHLCVDPIIVATQIVTALQTIVSRSLSPYASAVVSVTTLHAGETSNVIPSTATLGGTMRDFDPAVAATLRRRMETIVHDTCHMHGAEGTVTLVESYPTVINTPLQTQVVQQVAATVRAVVSEDGLPMMAAEDFAYYLEQRPGCFFFLGTKQAQTEQGRDLHSDSYDFNDDVLPLGVRMFVGLVEHRFACSIVASEPEWTALFR
ncbi:hypothetical protein H257_01462 [Aphanomyces astaci]|uniref:Peptidase M20 dimerisation domain-containing protein n=1 Tax=Aphanomyces astaci TaxID=112090 RepID=W4H894_APHAT|nr:hypothetical protein H257_01462 [Aphanomyces astaci]ETV88107.1 hypothetical protein H257_01462 [Aphanomyces astaci]RQM21387.1 hypothetical protein B5M09_001240 [Aphanomyces astaci]|eukprot:XP_009822970.1 hypothetical protein H257_01462 [Aphanomyces astaci]